MQLGDGAPYRDPYSHALAGGRCILNEVPTLTLGTVARSPSQVSVPVGGPGAYENVLRETARL